VTTSSNTRVDATYRRIRADIIAGRLAPGTRLLFAEMTKRYEASTGVLREALPRLVEQGLVVSQPQIGFRVVSLSISDLRQLTEARVAIETLVLRQSVTHGDLAWETAVLAAHHLLVRTPQLGEGEELTDDWIRAHATFHRMLLSGSPNRRMRNIADSLRDSAEVYRGWSSPFGRKHDRDVAAEHRQLLDTALARNAEDAATVLIRHIELSTELLIEGSGIVEGDIGDADDSGKSDPRVE
jgi:DNA-binding GntR family transcriptional regulator